MEGKSLPKIFWQFSLYSFTLLCSAETLADSHEIEKYERALQIAREQLDRAVNGRDPCHSTSCQIEKTELLDEISIQIDRLPLGIPVFEESSLRALTSAWRLIENPFPLPRNSVDESFSFSELKNWWERRYSHDLKLRSSWTGLYGQLLMIEKAIGFYLQLVSSSPARRADFLRAWNGGLKDYTELERESSIYFYRIRQLEAGGLEGSNEIERLELAREMLNRERERIKSQLPDSPYRLLEKLFPNFQAPESAFILGLISHWLDIFPSNDLFDEERALILQKLENRVENLKENVRSFQELEYGLVGLRNFESMTNPVVAINYELGIQEKLGLAEGVISGILDLGSWSALYSFSASLGMGKALLTSGLLGLGSYYSIEYDLSYSEIFFEPQNRRGELFEQLPKFEQQMARRHQTLKYVRDVLLQKIESYEKKLDELEGNDD